MQRDISTTDIDITHHIQRGVLIRLRQHGPQSYVQLKPDGLEGNAYNYHLRNLKKSGLITVKGDVYHLTHTGHLVSDAFSFTSHRLMLRPYHYTTLLVTQDDSVLVYIPIRNLQAGKYCLPSGKLHYGDSIAASIGREMDRRLLSAEYTFSEISPVNIRYTLHGEIAAHRPGVIWHIAYEGNQAVRTTESGTTQWLSIREVMNDPRTLPELSLGLQKLTSLDRAPIDLDYAL